MTERTARTAPETPREGGGPPGWTEQRVARLRELWAQRRTCAEIAKALGGVSRNAVIGKARRLRLPEHGARSVRSRSGAARRHKARSARLNMARLSRWLRRAPAIPADQARDLPAEPVPIPRNQRRTLVQLTRRTCRWPIGDPGTGDLYFCGAPSVARRPYCRAHCAIAYLPPEATEQEAKNVYDPRGA
jgi:GcrA cell cycle regulator